LLPARRSTVDRHLGDAKAREVEANAAECLVGADGDAGAGIETIRRDRILQLEVVVQSVIAEVAVVGKVGVKATGR